MTMPDSLSPRPVRPCVRYLTFHRCPLAVVHVPACRGSRDGFLVAFQDQPDPAGPKHRFLAELCEFGYAHGQLVPDELAGPLSKL
jgi:hypothetical protein